MSLGLMRRLPSVFGRFGPTWIRAQGTIWFWRYLVKPFSDTAYWQHWMNTSEVGDPDFQEAWEKLQVIETRRWLKRARQVYLGLDAVPLPEGQKSYWESGRFSEEEFVPDDVLRKLKVLVENAEGERIKRRKDEAEVWTKWITTIAAVIAAVASVWNLFLSKGH
jgi:hypothetical protein